MAVRESAFGRRKKKRTPDTISAQGLLPPLVCLLDVILFRAFNVRQSDFTGNEYSFEGGILSANSQKTFEHSIKSYEKNI